MLSRTLKLFFGMLLFFVGIGFMIGGFLLGVFNGWLGITFIVIGVFLWAVAGALNWHR